NIGIRRNIGWRSDCSKPFECSQRPGQQPASSQHFLSLVLSPAGPWRGLRPLGRPRRPGHLHGARKAPGQYAPQDVQTLDLTLGTWLGHRLPHLHQSFRHRHLLRGNRAAGSRLCRDWPLPLLHRLPLQSLVRHRRVSRHQGPRLPS
ncbi:hypothetical protein LTR48_009182, partial [Friedmanniomyces endolithicus]